MSRANRPSFVFILADDLGYADLGCYGGRAGCSPSLDRMAATGSRFTDGYANSPVCSPSRAALRSGRYPGNAGVRAILAGHRTTPGLHPSVPTIATALKKPLPKAVASRVTLARRTPGLARKGSREPREG